MSTITRFAVAATLAAGLFANAQVLDLTKRFQVISRKDTKKLYTDLNKAGQNHIRVVTGSFTGGEELTLMLEQDADKGVYNYLVVTAGNMTRLEQQVSHAAAQGYRMLANTITLKSKMLGSGDVAMVFEKGPRYKGSYEYLLLDASMAATMQVTLAGAIDQGYRVIGMLRQGKQTLIVLEKAS